MTFYIAPVVEGQTEVSCVNCLIERVWTELLGYPEPLQVLPPSRGARDQLVNLSQAKLAEKIEEAHLRLRRRVRKDLSPSRGLVLLLLDAENDCPAALAPRLLQRAKQARGDADISCVLAKRMLENWIVAGASALAGINGLPNPLSPRDQYEDRSGAFWIEQQLRTANPNRKYKKRSDATVFMRHIALTECRQNSPSFDKLCRELEARLPSNPTAAVPDGSTP